MSEQQGVTDYFPSMGRFPLVMAHCSPELIQMAADLWIINWQLLSRRISETIREIPQFGNWGAPPSKRFGEPVQ